MTWVTSTLHYPSSDTAMPITEPLVPFQRLSAAELKALHAPARTTPYALFLGGLRVGEGGSGTAAEEGVSKAQLKNRLKASATQAGVTIAFLPSGPGDVVFKVVSRRPLTPTPHEDQPEEPRRPQAGTASEGR